MEEKRCLVIRFVAWGPPCAATDADEGLGVSDIFVGVGRLVLSITVERIQVLRATPRDSLFGMS
jgi:hypothetical protein